MIMPKLVLTGIAVGLAGMAACAGLHTTTHGTGEKTTDWAVSFDGSAGADARPKAIATDVPTVEKTAETSALGTNVSEILSLPTGEGIQSFDLRATEKEIVYCKVTARDGVPTRWDILRRSIDLNTPENLVSATAGVIYLDPTVDGDSLYSSQPGGGGTTTIDNCGNACEKYSATGDYPSGTDAGIVSPISSGCTLTKDQIKTKAKKKDADSLASASANALNNQAHNDHKDCSVANSSTSMNVPKCAYCRVDSSTVTDESGGQQATHNMDFHDDASHCTCTVRINSPATPTIHMKKSTGTCGINTNHTGDYFEPYQ